MAGLIPRRRGDVLVRAVHDVKNPLAVVRAALEWLEVELADREEALDAVRDASTAASRLLSIVDDLDALARLERGDAVQHDALDLTAIIGDVTAAASVRLAPRGLTVTAVTPGALQRDGDVELLARAFAALIDTCARGASSGTCIELVARVTGDEAAAGASIEIEIGHRGTLATGPETDGLDALGTDGLGPYLAGEVAQFHGGSLVAIPTSKMPRALFRLPR